MGDCKLKPILVYHTENPCALKGYEKNSLPVHWYSNSSGWMMGHTFQEYCKTQLLGKLKEYCLFQGFPFKILMVLDNTLAHPQMLQDLYANIPLNIQPIVFVRGLKRQQVAALTNFVRCFFLALSYFFFLSFGAE